MSRPVTTPEHKRELRLARGRKYRAAGRERAWKEANPDRVRELDRKSKEKTKQAVRARALKGGSHAIASRRRRTGWTQEHVDAAFEAQGGRCALCAVALDTGLGQTAMVVDHDHSTGARRGLLCRRCNTLEGMHLKLLVDDEEWGRRVRAYRARAWPRSTTDTKHGGGR